MTTEEAEVLSNLRHSLKNIADAEEDILKFSRSVVKETNGVQDFVNGKISKLFRLASTYKNAFERLKVTNKKDFDQVVKKSFRHHDIQDLEHTINDTEVEWDELLQDLDQQLQQGGVSTLSTGQEGPTDVILEDARTVREGALQWLKETKCPYPMLLDTERKIYSAFGLNRSVYKVWSVSAMLFYAEKMAQGVPLPKPYENVHDDTQQMGGDFVLDKEGKVQFVYCSQQSWDRPSVDLLLQVLKGEKQ